MLPSEGHTYEAGWFAATIISSELEVGRDKYGFYHKTSHYSKGK
jgi:hypothetical protein